MGESQLIIRGLRAEAAELRAERARLWGFVAKIRSMADELAADIPYDHGNATANHTAAMLHAAVAELTPERAL